MRNINLINWKQLSIKLSGNPYSIRKGNIPKKYKQKVESLFLAIDVWDSNN